MSKVEYQSANGGPDTRAGMEDRWEVRGLGKAVDITAFLGWTGGPAWEAVAYPRCGYDQAEGWYGILYKTPATGAHQGEQMPKYILHYDHHDVAASARS